MCSLLTTAIDAGLLHESYRGDTRLTVEDIPSQRVRKALRGEATDRPVAGPLAVHFCARQSGVTLREYSSDAGILADCILRYYERYRPDAVWVSADTWVTAEAMGAKTFFPDDDQPMCGTGEALVRCAGDIDRLLPPDPTTRGRMPLMLEALDRVQTALGGDAFVVACFDQLPFSLACALMGASELMLAMVDDPAMVEALLHHCSEHCLAYALAMAQHGADMLSGGDSPAGLIGPDYYGAFALPAERTVFSALKKGTEVPLSLHICGNATPILPQMATSGADVLEIDHQVDFAAARETVDSSIALWGNLDPVAVLANGGRELVQCKTEELLRAARRNDGAGFVLSSGCTLAIETPSENLQAMLTSGRRWPPLDEPDARMS